MSIGSALELLSYIVSFDNTNESVLTLAFKTTFISSFYLISLTPLDFFSQLSPHKLNYE